MSTRVLIIDGHPDPDRARFVHALADACADGARAAGHDLRRIDIATLDLPVLRSPTDYRDRPAPPAAMAAQQDIAWAQHIVILFPLWMGGPPALLKAFLEQVLRPGFAAETREGGLPVKLLKGRSARLIVTMGMPALAYRWWFGAHGVKSLKSGVLGLAGLAPLRETYFGRVETVADTVRRSWLEQARDAGRSAR